MRTPNAIDDCLMDRCDSGLQLGYLELARLNIAAFSANSATLRPGLFLTAAPGTFAAP